MNARRRERSRIIIRPADPIDSIRRFLELADHMKETRFKLGMVIVRPFFLNSPGLILTPEQKAELEQGKKLSRGLIMILLEHLDDLVAASDAELPVPVFRIQPKPQIPSATEDQEEDLPAPKTDADTEDEKT